MAETLVNIQDIARQAAETAVARFKEAGVPAAQTRTLTEAADTRPKVSYKSSIVAALKDITQNQHDYFAKMETVVNGAELKEGIGLVAGTAAIPDVWAKDVFRCCPYPASAFWDAPFIIRLKPF
jgi:hypothetical protein